jgi:hypothetical protein
MSQAQSLAGPSRKYEPRTHNPSAQEVEGSGKHQKNKTMSLHYDQLISAANPAEGKVRLRQAQGQQQRTNVPAGAVKAQMAYDNKARTAMQ